MGKKAPSLFQVLSTSSGLSWSSPVSVDDMLGQSGLAMGPGIGVQVSSGRLLAMGHGGAMPFKTYNHDVLIASDDHAKSWQILHTFNSTTLDEPQLAVLPSGHIMANVRTTNGGGGCKCRAVATSLDTEGNHWSSFGTAPELISPGCQGSILGGKTSVWFANPANKTARATFTVRKSTDNAQTWKSTLVDPTPGCGYSSLQFLQEDETVGFLWESSPSCTIKFAPVTL